MFRKGDRVVHPKHGAAAVEDLVELERFGEQRVYVKLRLPHGLTLMVPVESTEQVGLRKVVSRDELDEVFDLLRGDEGLMPILWSRRYRANLAKLISGDIYHVAEVVRNLSCRERARGLSGAEKQMLAKAREILISELILVVGSTEGRRSDAGPGPREIWAALTPLLDPSPPARGIPSCLRAREHRGWRRSGAEHDQD